MLKVTEIPWPGADPEIQAALKVPPEDLPRSTLIKLLRELDRRQMQMQDKVAFERVHGLVDYSPIMKGNASARLR
jgi:hypothetical protein